MMSILRSVPINLRLTSLIVFFSIGLFVVVYSALSMNKQSLLDEKSSQTQYVVETATGVFNYFHKLEQTGQMSKADAQRFAMAMIKDTRYADSEYFWINDYNANMVMHSINSSLDGRNLSNMEDPSGKKLFSEFVTIVRAQNEGFVDYLWPKPGSENPVEKISYVKGFQPWGWIIGSGVYLDDVDAQFQQEAVKLGIISTIIVLISLFISFLIVRSIILPITQIQSALHNISEGDGDLRARLPESGKDQLTQIAIHYNTFAGRLSHTLSKAVSLNQDVENKSKELRSVAGKTQAITEQREGMFLQMAEKIREVDGFKDEVIHNTQSTLSSAQSSVEKTQTGQNAINQTVKSLEKLTHELEEGLDSVVQLAEQSQTIGTVLDVISAIAEQTNLLALNAAIEAARAGEQGRGFAVVADEVRGLASRTQASTDEIQAMISKLQSGAKVAEARITASHQQSQKTTEEITLTNQYLQAIASSVNDINTASSTVLRSVNLQSEAVQSLNQLNEKVAELSSRAGLLVQENNRTSESLAKTTQETQQVMSIFKL